MSNYLGTDFSPQPVPKFSQALRKGPAHQPAKPQGQKPWSQDFPNSFQRISSPSPMPCSRAIFAKIVGPGAQSAMAVRRFSQALPTNSAQKVSTPACTDFRRHPPTKSTQKLFAPACAQMFAGTSQGLCTPTCQATVAKGPGAQTSQTVFKNFFLAFSRPPCAPTFLHQVLSTTPLSNFSHQLFAATFPPQLFPPTPL